MNNCFSGFHQHCLLKSRFRQNLGFYGNIQLHFTLYYLRLSEQNLLSFSLLAWNYISQTLNLDLVGAQKVRWEGDGTEPAGEHTFFYRKGNENHELGTISFLCIRESYKQLRGLSLLVTGYHTYEYY
jgi:hypothetical protein